MRLSDTTHILNLDHQTHAIGIQKTQNLKKHGGLEDSLAFQREKFQIPYYSLVDVLFVCIYVSKSVIGPSTSKFYQLHNCPYEFYQF